MSVGRRKKNHSILYCYLKMSTNRFESYSKRLENLGGLNPLRNLPFTTTFTTHAPSYYYQYYHRDNSIAYDGAISVNVTKSDLSSRLHGGFKRVGDNTTTCVSRKTPHVHVQIRVVDVRISNGKF